ncbi:MAG: hypothetical protein AB7R89_06210 [Dehalococcoidia bacterium]
MIIPAEQTEPTLAVPAAPFIALAYPSRGTGYAPTIFGALRELAPYPHVLCPAFYRPMPDSHNDALLDALADERVTHVWFLEDDHLLPVGVLSAMLAADAPVVAAPYRLRGGNRCELYTRDGRLALVGLGCTLIRRDVFEHPMIGYQPFDVGQLLWDGSRWVEPRPGKRGSFCGPDTYFCKRLQAAEIPIRVLDDAWEVGHFVTEHQAARGSHGVDWLRCIGGARVMPWYPPRRTAAMAVRYFRSPGGLVMDLDEAKGGQVAYRLKQGWKEITKKEFDAAHGKQEKLAEEKREEWIQGMEE